MDSRGVNVTVDDAKGVKMSHTGSKLSENAKNLLVRELVLAKLFPGGNVIWRFGFEHQRLNFIYQHDRLQQV